MREQRNKNERFMSMNHFQYLIHSGWEHVEGSIGESKLFGQTATLFRA